MSEPRKAKTIIGLFFCFIAFAVYLLAQSSGGNKGGGGGGTVTHTAGNLTLNCNVVGNGVADLKCSAVTTDDGTTFTTSGTSGLLVNGTGAPITSTQGTMTTSNPFLNHTATWNAAGVAFTDSLSNITCTAAATASIAAGFGTAGTQFQFKYGAANCGSPQLLLPLGTAANASLASSGGGINSGVNLVTTAQTCLDGGGNYSACDISGGGLQSSSSGFYSFTSTGLPTGATGTKDTAIVRNAAGVLGVSDGGANTNGRVKAAGYMSVGATFTSNGGCGDTTLVGGATAGKYTSVTAGTCTTIITMGNSATAPNGWSCTATDLTTIGDIGNIKQSATAPTTASLNETTVAANDVIQFSCVGY